MPYDKNTNENLQNAYIMLTGLPPLLNPSLQASGTGTFKAPNPNPTGAFSFPSPIPPPSIQLTGGMTVPSPALLKKVRFRLTPQGSSSMLSDAGVARRLIPWRIPVPPCRRDRAGRVKEGSPSESVSEEAEYFTLGWRFRTSSAWFSETF
jgi:hypothetical protein